MPVHAQLVIHDNVRAAVDLHGHLHSKIRHIVLDSTLLVLRSSMLGAHHSLGSDSMAVAEKGGSDHGRG